MFIVGEVERRNGNIFWPNITMNKGWKKETTRIQVVLKKHPTFKLENSKALFIPEKIKYKYMLFKADYKDIPGQSLLLAIQL